VNPKEANSKRLLDVMEAFNTLTLDERKLTTENIRPVETEFVAASQVLLKSEWRRVKSGEWTFRIAKLLALTVILVSAVVGGSAAYKMWWLERPVSLQVRVPQSKPATGGGIVTDSAAGSSKTVGSQ
jgi:hypothetical protein